MLNLNIGRQWRPWPGDAEAAVLLSPLTVKKQRALQKLATTTEGKGRHERQVFDADKFQDLVADECIHGLKGFTADAGPETQRFPLEYSSEIARRLMDLDAFNAFVFRECQTMGLAQVAELEKAGNG